MSAPPLTLTISYQGKEVSLYPGRRHTKIVRSRVHAARGGGGGQMPADLEMREYGAMNAVEIVGLEWLGSLALFLGFILLIRFLDHRERMAMIDRGLMPPRLSNPIRRAGS